MNSLNLRDWLQIAVSLVGFTVVIITVKTDVRWLKRWCGEHKKDDERQFKEMKQDLRDLRFEVRQK